MLLHRHEAYKYIRPVSYVSYYPRVARSEILKYEDTQS
jgi:hypothetical protein